MSPLVLQWQMEYDELKLELNDIGHKADGLEYNVIAAQAMRLHECILDLVLRDAADSE